MHYANSTWIIDFTTPEAKTAAEAALAKIYPDIKYGWLPLISEEGDEYMNSDTRFIIMTYGAYEADEKVILTTIAPFVKSAVVEFNTDSNSERWSVSLVDGKPVTVLPINLWADKPEAIVGMVTFTDAKRIYEAIIAEYGAEAFTD